MEKKNSSSAPQGGRVYYVVNGVVYTDRRAALAAKSGE